MGRFSAWALAQEVAANPSRKDLAAPSAEEVVCVVDNARLHSRSRGLRFRRSPDLEDKDLLTKPAPFGTTVKGALINGGWLKVGHRYLPTHVDGVAVVRQVGGDPQDAPALDRAKLGHMPSWLLGDVEPYAEVPAALQPAAAPSPRTRPDGGGGGGRAEGRGGDDDAGVAGRGDLYVVTAEKVVVRSQPSMDGLVENVKHRGDIIELFEWDESKQWRKCFEAGTHFGMPGWMRLCHPVHGPLMWPLEPVCVASARGNLMHLQECLQDLKIRTWRGSSGCSPLRLAAERGFLECCMVLVHAGADYEALLEEGVTLPWRLRGATARALFGALSGRNFDLAAYEAALEALPADFRELAERLFDDVARKLEESREVLADAASGDEALDEETIAELIGNPRDVPSAAADAPVAPAGRGEPYRIRYKHVWIRSLPRPDADGIGTRRQGDIVELHDFDATGQWRRICMGMDAAIHEPKRSGWMLLHHEVLGPLLEPAAVGLAGGGARPGAEGVDASEAEDEDVTAEAPDEGWKSLFWRS